MAEPFAVYLTDDDWDIVLDALDFAMLERPNNDGALEWERQNEVERVCDDVEKQVRT